MTDNKSKLIHSIYKSRLTLLEQLKAQGYNTENYDGFSINDVSLMEKNDQLNMMVSNDNNDTNGDSNGVGRKTYVMYELVKTLRGASLEEIVYNMFDVENVLTNKDTLIVVIKDNVNETMANCVKHVWDSGKFFVILHPLENLSFNVLTHVLVPPHRTLTPTEKINVMTRRNINNDSEWPQLSRNDPAAKAIGIRPGEVCEILRPSEQGIVEPYWRICINL